VIRFKFRLLLALTLTARITRTACSIGEIANKLKRQFVLIRNSVSLAN